MTEYNRELCEEKHKNIKEEFNAVWKRMNGFDKKLWAVIVLLLMNLSAIIYFAK